MYESKKLKEKRAEMVARCEAIFATGELTDELRSELDRLQGIGEEGQPDFKAGEIHRLDADIKRLEAIEARTASTLKRHTTTTGGNGYAVVSDTEPFARCEALTIPVRQQFRHGKLKAFANTPLGEKQAYLAGQFFLATLTKNDNAVQWCKDHGIGLGLWNAAGENQNQLGGVLVPDEVERTIIDLRESRGTARQECMVTGMAGDTKYVPRRTGGLTAYFIDENPSSAITESDKNWDSVRLIARTLATLSRYSVQLSDDSIISIGDDLASEIAYAFADKEDQCLFNGDGTSTYGGIVGLKNGTAAGSKYTAATGNTAFSTLDREDFEGMVGKLPQYAEPNAKWYISKPGWAASILRLVDAAGGNTWRDLANGKRELSFLGYPVVIVQVMNTTLTAQTSTDGLVYFGDMRQAVTFGNRRGVSVFPSEHRYMEFNQIGVRGFERFDLNYHERGTASVAGSLIMLSTPGS
jgi:HK97 family phage major capsid protein